MKKLQLVIFIIFILLSATSCNLILWKTITLDTNGGTIIENISLLEGTSIKKPIDPEKEGCIFGGWYSDAELTLLWDFNSVVNDNMTLYVKWLKAYTLKHFQQNVSGAGYTLFSSETLTGPTGSTVSAAVATYTGFQENSSHPSKVAGGILSRDGSLVLQLFYDRITYTVTYNSNGGSAVSPVSNVRYGAGIAEPAAPAKSGYAVNGWFKEPELSNAWNFTTDTITEDITLEAHWEELRYPINYNLDGGTNSQDNPDEYSVSSENISFAAPVKAGYTFLGWVQADNQLTPVNGIQTGSIGTVSVLATWSANQYTLYIKSNGAGAPYYLPRNMYSGTSYRIFLSPNPPWSKTGYTYQGLSTVVDGVVAYQSGDTIVMGAENITLYAVWDAAAYSISYQLNGGINNSDNPIEYTILSDTITFSAPSRVHYTFLGWYNSSLTTIQTTQIPKGSTGNVLLEARWKNIDYSITYDLVGGTNSITNPDSFTYFSETITLSDPAKTGYTFLGWYDSPEAVTATTQIPANTIGNVELEARWELTNYSITYDLEGGTNSITNPDTYTIETAAIELQAPARTGYIFSGWYSSSAAVTRIETGSYGDLSLEAQWEIIEYDINYVMNGGTNSSSNPSTYTIASETITPANPTRLGYTFQGWYQSSDFENSVTGIASGSYRDVTLFARWEIITYTISYTASPLYTSNSPENPSSYTVESDTIVLQAPVMIEGWTYKGWSDNVNQIFIIPNGSTGNISIRILASKDPLNTLTLSFDANGGSGSMAPIETKAGYSVAIPNNGFSRPADNSYLVFKGWAVSPAGAVVYEAYDSYTVSSDIEPDSTMILYAKWSEYTVGDKGPGGGYIFYDKGDSSGGWRYKQLAPITWCLSSATSERYESNYYYVKNLPCSCDSSWSVPTRDDFKLIFSNLHSNGIKTFDNNRPYWTADEYTYEVVVEEHWYGDDVEIHTGCYLFSFNPDSYEITQAGHGYIAMGEQWGYAATYISDYAANLRPMRKF